MQTKPPEQKLNNVNKYLGGGDSRKAGIFCQEMKMRKFHRFRAFLPE
jgi:hypothetical protein